MPRRRYRRRKGLSDSWDSETWEATIAPEPCEATPGSAAKVEAVKDRLWKGCKLFSDKDAKPFEWTATTVHEFLLRLSRTMNQQLINGVYKTKGGKWRAYPWDDEAGRHVHLKLWDKEEDAIAVVVAWRKRHGKGTPTLPDWLRELQEMVRDMRKVETLAVMSEKETGSGAWQDDPEPEEDEGWLERAIAEMRGRYTIGTTK
jgi:hypothetical protein